MVHGTTGLWHDAGFNVSRWLMIIIHGYRATTLLLSIFLNVMVRTEYPTAVTAEIVAVNENSLETGITGKSLDIDLPPTLPMSFGTENSTMISAQSGSIALLPCVVHNLGDGVVSWIKRKNVQELLTIGRIAYAYDERFQPIHFHHSEDWTLQIKYVQPRDAGLYECQVSTHPPTSIFLFLEVVEARAEIDGPSEKFVRPGSTLQLHCEVKKSTETPSYLFWYHNFRMINFDGDRGVNVSTDLTGRESWLEVPRASDRHSGNYTCEASNAQPARVLVHVFKGDNPAAMQHSIASSPSIMACSALLMMFTTLKLVLHSTTTN
ncbi:hemicentin-1 [Osmia lignaria lignaria]|uniref:hemicentin-1 n=1 Tax=Osmia lignaria lignaria TaxID=1437193 RepID=UPI001478DD44|nr:limbic system-associated membrane protein-like [Osmia lignaria]XP_034178138.1 limbic system-associated membrane protein-like [Osmia lignaria]XP_034178139.1 limbic system-associated membrane protein-like [Osmia lignaria]